VLGREKYDTMIDLTELSAISVPMPWQNAAWQQLHQQIQGDQLPHAILIAGMADTGKNRMALALARLLLCHTPQAGHNCGHCHACDMSRVGSHGDFRWLEPEGKSRVIKVDQIREVVVFGTKTASLGQRKVIVFSPAENMNANAANALLKSLEEPARDTYLILVCHRLHGLPATIRSRCQQMRLPPPTQRQSIDWLEQLTGNRSEGEQLLDFADDRPMLAETLYRAGDIDAIRAIPVALETLKTPGGSVPKVAALLGQLSVDDALSQCASYLARAIFAAAKDGQSNQQSRQLFVLLDEIHRMQNAVVSGANPNPQLLLESLLARVQKNLGGG
jgi:DNA polymerase-3 subunit delta'